MLIISALQTILILLVAPAVVGLTRTLKARFQNRRGASIFQPYVALASLFRKEMTITTQSSWVFRAVPFAVLASALLLSFLVPTLGYGGMSWGNIFLVAAVATIGSIFLVFGGMDTGSAFGNMGASREMTLVSLVEPAFLMSFTALGFIAGAWDLSHILAAFSAHPWYAMAPFSVLVFIGLFLVILTENARYPVDNPATHLELTMVHEAMLLEYSGPYLALLEYASAVKLTVLGIFLASLVIPLGLVGALSPEALLIGVTMLILKAVLVCIAIATVESLVVKMRFYRMQEYLSLAYLASAAGFLLSLFFLNR